MIRSVRVGLFVTCLVDLVRPGIGFAALRLLHAAGCETVVPAAQTCCGQPGWNSGVRAAARALAEKLIGEFETFDAVVVPSGSCAGMIRIHYPKLFAGEAAWLARCEALAAKTFELTEFLADVVRVTEFPHAQRGTFAYHDSCAGLRELGIREQPRRLLAAAPQATLVEMKDCETCCGFGGTFSIKFGEISAAMVDAKCDHIAASGAAAVALGDLGCMLNIEGRLRRRGDERTRVLHIAEVLAGPEA